MPTFLCLYTFLQKTGVLFVTRTYNKMQSYFNNTEYHTNNFYLYRHTFINYVTHVYIILHVDDDDANIGKNISVS